MTSKWMLGWIITIVMAVLLHFQYLQCRGRILGFPGPPAPNNFLHPHHPSAAFLLCGCPLLHDFNALQINTRSLAVSKHLNFTDVDTVR